MCEKESSSALSNLSKILQPKFGEKLPCFNIYVSFISYLKASITFILASILRVEKFGSAEPSKLSKFGSAILR